MKKVLLSIMIGLILILIISVITISSFAKVDYERVLGGEKPLHCFNSENPKYYLDGGTKEYNGLGYKIIDFNKLNGYTEVKLAPFWAKLDDFADEYESYNEKPVVIEQYGSDSEAKTWNVYGEKAESLGVIISNADNISPYTLETCDGKSDYSVTLRDGEKYNIEVYENEIHILKEGKGESVLTNKDDYEPILWALDYETDMQN